ncbi:MAG: hypothetical protein DCC69_00665 [Hyphomicrobiales bacterium]|nr:MAG: hypothetical protein DCC69_00665 [Hyphomicrobiales bacterium]
MNESVDFPSLFEKNVAQLRTYLQDSWPISEDCQRRSKSRPLGGAKVVHLAAHLGNAGRA